MTLSARILLTGTALWCMAAGANAQTLAQWNFTGDVLTPTTVGAGVTASSISNASLTLFSATGGLLQGAPAAGATGGTNNIASAITANSYFQFTLTPLAGQSMSLSAQAFTAGFPNNTSAVIRTSVDNFGSNLGSATNGSSTLTPYSFSLGSIPAFQNRTTAVTFRVYLHGANNNVASQFDNLTISGAAAAIPEPGSLALIGVGLAGGAALLRRRRAA